MPLSKNKLVKKIHNHFINSSNVIKELIYFEKEILLFADKILKTRKANKVLVGGNGGSCADADHFTGELQCTFKDRNRKPISAISLNNSFPAITAWCNDFSFDTYFLRQVQAHGRKRDVLVLLSTGGGDIKSGASINMISAAKLAIKKKMFVISLVGKTGGSLKKISNLCIHVKSDNTAYIQEAHMSILHCVAELLDDLMK